MNINDGQNWYTRFDPVGSMGNVHFLIPNKSEWNATVTARRIADALGQPIVTLKRIVPKDKQKVITW